MKRIIQFKQLTAADQVLKVYKKDLNASKSIEEMHKFVT